MPGIRKIITRFFANFLFSLLVPLAVIAPDFLAQIFNSYDQVILSDKFLLGAYIFGLVLSFAPRAFIFTILSFFICLELIQFGHLFYYHSFITSFQLKLLFIEYEDIFLAAKEASGFLYGIAFLVLIPYALLSFSLTKLENKRFKSSLAIIPVILFLAIIPYRVQHSYHGANYYPDPTDHSLRNSLYAFTNCLLNVIKPVKTTNKYQDYQIIDQQKSADNINIILIVGESTNDKHMSLLGYKRDTNPLLNQLKNDPNFIYMHGLSSSVSTLSSFPLLFNSAYEPNNLKPIEQQKANLFKLAKDHNFKSFFISSQPGARLTNIGAEFIDYTMFYNKNEALFDQYKDEALLKIIPTLNYAESNFIVINQRNAHTPYETNYPKGSRFDHFSVDRSNYKQFMIDTYDNAMLYNDYIISEIINFYRHKFAGTTYILFTSDHGEEVDGNNGIYGHSILAKEVAEIPFIAYIKNGDSKIIQKIKQSEPICHYEIDQIIASIMGFEIINPNFKPGICYIHGTDLYGNNEFIEYNKNK